MLRRAMRFLLFTLLVLMAGAAFAQAPLLPPITAPSAISPTLPNQAAAPAPAAAVAAPVTAADMRAVMEQRCLVCHNAQMQQKNVALHTPELLKQQALSVYQQVSVLKLMPMNNATQITDAERDLVRRWWEAGAPVR